MGLRVASLGGLVDPEEEEEEVGVTVGLGLSLTPRIERILIELMTSDCKLKASREGSK